MLAHHDGGDSAFDEYDSLDLGYDPVREAQDDYVKQVGARRTQSGDACTFGYNLFGDAGSDAFEAVDLYSNVKGAIVWNAIKPRAPGGRNEKSTKEVNKLIVKKYASVYDKVMPAGAKPLTRKQLKMREYACMNHFQRRSVEDKEELFAKWVGDADVSRGMQSMLKDLVIRAKVKKARKILKATNVDRTLATVMVNGPNTARTETARTLLLVTKWMPCDALPKAWVKHNEKVVHVHSRT